jgi:hypothetical protein
MKRGRISKSKHFFVVFLKYFLILLVGLVANFCFLVEKTGIEEVKDHIIDTSKSDRKKIWINVLDGSEIYKSPEDNSTVLGLARFRSYLNPTGLEKNGWIEVEWKNKNGWVLEEEISQEPPKESGYFVPEHLEEICDEIKNSSECYAKVEQEVLKDSEYASRKGKILSVKIKEDEILEFVNKSLAGDASEFYFYIDYIEEIKLHMIHLSKYEGGVYLGIHHPTGQRIQLVDFPEVSPDGKRIATSYHCPEMNYCKNGVQIFSVSEKGLERELELTEWKGSDPVWLGNNEISLYFYEKGFFKEPTGKGRLVLRKSKWQLEQEDF